MHLTSETLGEAKAILEFSEGCQVLIVLPTGERKCLCFPTILLIFDYLRAKQSAGDVIHSTTVVSHLHKL